MNAAADTADTADTAPPYEPGRPRIHRRLLLSAVGGLGALGVPAGARWWADRVPARGPRIWGTTAAGGRIVLSDDGRGELYVCGYDGAVRAHDPRTGAVRWSTTVGTADDVDSWGGWPLAAGSGAVCVNLPTAVRALDAASGEVRWELPVPDWRDLPQEPGLVVAGEHVLAGCGTALRCHDLATGEVRWSSPADVSAVPLVVGDTVYVPGRTRGLLALDLRDGTRRWSQEAVGPADFAPTLHQGVLHLASNDRESGGATVHALDAADGRSLWQRRRRRAPGPLVATGGAVCLLSGNELTALDAGTGDTRWTETVPSGLGRGMSAMTAAAGTVYTGTNDDRLFAHDLARGHLRWRDEPDHLAADTPYTRVALATTGSTTASSTGSAAGSTVYRATRTGIQCLGTPRSGPDGQSAGRKSGPAASRYARTADPA